MEYVATPGPRPGAPLQVTENVVPGTEDWLPRVSGQPTWATGLEGEYQTDPEPSEKQRLQISKELIDLQIATHRLREQHEAEVFELKREVLRLESRVLELELHGNGDCRGHGVQPAASPGQHKVPPQEPAFVHQQKLQGELNLVLEHHRVRQQALETRVAVLGWQLQRAQEEARAADQRLAAQAMVLSACQDQLRQAEAENAQLQLQLKKLNEEYAVRLQRYAKETVETTNSTGQAALQTFLEATLQDIRAAHRSREQQLAQAARTYRKRLADLSRRQELLLSTCRPHPKLRAFGAVGFVQSIKGPHHVLLQYGRYRTLLLCPEKVPGATSKEGRSQPLARHTTSWSQIQQKLRDFSQDTQVELERERAQLMVRATMAEQQLSELQEYVDQHLGRYKQEIQRLRKLVKTGDPQGVEAMPSSRPRRPRTQSH
ncbi:Coiled-coil domain-containing protein 78 [Microtus ochrogaster]|uniref:Coiled-coil domain-containing protein 78 n=1 Tax=Microtus ochrogaster TaxID=79684 RepID=A0A8J6L4S0_MICOH|nr:Coiled-coil domain-containing protein 78 [Microtus ochrogaster]